MTPYFDEQAYTVPPLPAVNVSLGATDYFAHPASAQRSRWRHISACDARRGEAMAAYTRRVPNHK